MFDIGWTELLLIGVVALIVIGPKDLPEMFRTFGRFTAKARGMAREFSRAMESAADEAGVKDVAKDLRSATSAKSMGLDAVKDAVTKFEKWDPMKPGKPPAAATPAAPAAPAANPVIGAAPPVAAKGPATQALADQLAAKRAARTKPVPAAEAVAGAAPKAAPKPKVAKEAAAAPDATAAKPARKPAAKPSRKSDA